MHALNLLHRHSPWHQDRLHRLPVSQRVGCFQDISASLPTDTVRFSSDSKAAKTLPLEEVTGSGEGISTEFRSLVREATSKVLKSIKPTGLKHALLDSGFKILLVNQPEDFFPHIPQYYNRKIMEQDIAEAYHLAKHEPESFQQVFIAPIIRCFPGDPGIQAIIQKAQVDPTSLQRNEMKALLYKVEAAGIMEQMDAPLFSDSFQQVVLPESIFREWQSNGFDLSVQNLEKIIRHETWHYIDDVLGPTLMPNKAAFSKSLLFRSLFKGDLQQAALNKLLPDPDEVMTIGNPIGSIVPLRVDQLQGPEENHAYAEAFAEIGASTQGGGGCDLPLLQKFCHGALLFVRQNVLKPFETKTPTKTASLAMKDRKAVS